ncbi:MAG: UDP-N-acetylmuramoyl-L-alanyl-D-glutamate--2,6-diaminopimelate ligase [Candidatus Beckwithbacteria bacterium]|nr:UDP-N-acetylmuramoyl-L-alanyl-D-glutamate--2,6-diaminopimelate ligase [Candidatus Beckwithbacteria bacterium]
MSFQKLRQLIPQRLINLLWHLPQAILANLIYGFPGKKLTVIGVTGTSGKTSVSHLLYHILKQNGFKVDLLSTISVPGLHVTNPEPFILQKLLKKSLDQGCTHVVLEVTSHGLDQYRNWGIKFKYGLITNITHEHLDYHKTFANYQQAKLKLLKMAETPIKFQDSANFVKANENAASAIAEKIGLSRSAIARSITTFPGVPGRMEFVQKKPFGVVIDFAHKPDALEKALIALRLTTKNRLIAVFGCAGLRDRLKRPMMGEISGRLADITVLTAEDPRTEDVNEIINQIKSGWDKAKKPPNRQLCLEPDRQAAINLAIKLAQPGDSVALFGKAHEKSMCFGTIETAWSEYRAVRQALCQI